MKSPIERNGFFILPVYEKAPSEKRKLGLSIYT